MEKSDILHILRRDQTVFSFKEILLASDDKNPARLRRRLHYYVSQGELYPLRRGFYAKNKNYNKLELATKIFTPSYISFETVLKNTGIIFQYSSSIFVASYQTKEIICDGQTYSFRQIKDVLLTDTTGIEQKDTHAIACAERAFLDYLYLHKDYYFDNLSPLDWDKVFSILPIYHNQRMVKKVQEHYKQFKSNQV